MKRKNKFIAKNAVMLTVAALCFIAAVVAAILLCRPFFSEENIRLSSVVSLERTETYLAALKKEEPEEPDEPEEPEEVETPTVAEPEVKDPTVTEKPSNVDDATYKEYLECMEKANELEATLTDDVTAWNMILCNPTHALPDGYIESVELKSIVSSIYKVDSRIWYNVRAMFLAAKMDGINLTMVSAFRDIDLQTRNFNNKKNYYINNGMSEADAYAKTATIIAVPGTSEHHTRLALDILSTEYSSLTADFDKTAAYKWLTEHCTEYGFILRYAKDKTDVTKIIYEPWHYRFVGIENAKKITASGLCYEEYLGILD